MSRKDDDSVAMAIGIFVVAVVGAVMLLWKGGKLAVTHFKAWRLRRSIAQRKAQSPAARAPVSVSPPHAEVMPPKAVVAVRQASSPVTPPQSAWVEHCERIERAWRSGDYDWARTQLQKIAYGMVDASVTDEERSLFKQTMMRFAAEDPLYLDVMTKMRPLLIANPGVVQSEIYKGQPDDIKEQMRYVLYFAEALGEVVRKKKGRSYALYLPAQLDDCAK